MKGAIVGLVVILLLAFMLGSAYVGRRNQMVTKREVVNAAWAQVDVVLQRRADLIPNLVETVKGYAAQEQKCVGRYRGSAGRFGWSQNTRGQDRSERAVRLGAEPLAGSGRELPAIK